MSGLYKLGEFEVDGLGRQLRLKDAVVPLHQKPFEVLLLLIARAGQVVSKEELMQAIWPEAFVEEANLTQSIFLLRKAFSQGASGSRYIVTVPGRGYQLGILPVSIETSDAHAIDLPLAPARVTPELLPGADENTNAGLPIAVLPPDESKGSRSRIMVFAVVLAIALLASVAGMSWLLLRPAPFSHATVRQLTNSGDAKVTAISRSGKYVAIVSRSRAGAEALSVSELRSGSSRVVVQGTVIQSAGVQGSGTPGAGIVFHDVAFSPDDVYLYYRSSVKGQPNVSSVSRVPLLGGEPTVVVNDVDGPIAFLDNGQRLCFLREIGDNGFAILSADAESGKDEKTLGKGDAEKPLYAICSPDGQKAALSTEVGGISILDFKTGRRQPFYSAPQEREIYIDLSWRTDGTELLASAITAFNPYPSILLISYPGGVSTQITHDLNAYTSSSMSQDGKTIVALQREKNAQFQSFDLPIVTANPTSAAEITSFPWTDFLGWRNDEEIVGSTVTGGLKMKDIATSQERSVQTARGAQFLQPSGCGTTGVVAAGSRPPDKAIAIWHMNADGSALKQLSHGPEDILPVCSPDGQWVFYGDNSDMGHAAIYRVAAQGGVPQKMGEGSVWFALSHDGRELAWIDANGRQQALALVRLVDGKRVATVPIPATLRVTRALTFAPDDQHLFVIGKSDTSDSIYELPLDGSPPFKRIEFRDAYVSTIEVSPTGKHLGAVTVKPVSDAVLLESARP